MANQDLGAPPNHYYPPAGHQTFPLFGDGAGLSAIVLAPPSNAFAAAAVGCRLHPSRNSEL